MVKLIELILMCIWLGPRFIPITPTPLPIDTVKGVLQWQSENPCGVSDYVQTEAMTQVFLTGQFTPTQGISEGCSLIATGSYYHVGKCTYFNTYKYEVSCPSKLMLAEHDEQFVQANSGHGFN